MSFLYYDDKTPDTKAIFKSLKADEYLIKDPGSGDYIPLSGGGGGGGGDLPYYLKPNAVEIAGAGTNTVLDSNSVDVTSTNYTASLGNGSFLVKHNSNNSAITISDTTIYVGNVHAGTSLIDTSKAYTTVGQLGIAFRTASGAAALNRGDVLVTNQLKALSAATPVGTSKMVTFNTATSAFAHADIPSAAPVVPKTYLKVVSVADFPCMNDAFNGFRNSRPVKTYTFGDNERIIFDFSTGIKIKYDRWYVVGLAMENAGLKSLIKASHIPYRYSEANSPTTVSCCYYGATAFTDGVNTVQPYHIAFGVSKSGKTISDDFTGYIEFHKVLHDAGTASTIVPT